MKRNPRKLIAFSIIVVAVFSAVAALQLSGVFNYLEFKTYDLRVNLFAASAKPSDEIIVILLDQDSLDWGRAERDWGFPWPRAAWAEFIDYMNAADAKAVALDLFFTEPSVYGEKDDEAFVRAAKDFGKVIQIVHFSTQTGSAQTWDSSLQAPLFEPSGFGSFLEKFELTDEGASASAQFPIPGILAAAGALGSDVGAFDPDGIVRRLSLFTLFDGKAVPGEAAAFLMIGGSGAAIQYDAKKKVIEWEGRRIPVDENGKSLLRFRGANFQRYIPYPMSVMLQSAEDYRNGKTPEYPPEDFKGKYVFCGYYAPGLFDIVTTPLSSVYPGMGAHITMLDNMLQEDFTQETPLALDMVLLFLGIAVAAALTVFPSKHQLQLSLGSMILFMAAAIGGSFFAYLIGWWLQVVVLLAGIAASYLISTLYNYATEGKQKQYIKKAFSQYLSPVFIDQLIANPEQLKLGGERKEISIFFSDIQGFSAISERLQDPAVLTELLNDYLTFMTNIILDSGGTIDKYEGDAIIAFWNAPLDLPDHAARALAAAMECQARLSERQDYYEEKYGARLITRIGLNTGLAVVGNMGSEIHYNYTMLGDAVNLAARLEGLNKQFGTFLMCTKHTFDSANDAAAAAAAAPSDKVVVAKPANKNGAFQKAVSFVPPGAFYGRKLASVAVVGKKEPAVVYEPLQKDIFEANRPVLEQFDVARDLFYAGKFAEALPLFEAIIKEDRPAHFYAAQCKYYIERAGEWKGYWQAMSK
ncbi:MAG: adenylate/guanylate cyclase domain-containing protein [Treponema sp.]|jgi:adenylate cyclase|nr:adenylate/guanylate cyclase domain-containing protein [Treponema sp.]